MEPFLSALVRWTLHHRRLTGILVLFGVALSLLGATRIHLDFSSASFYGDESPRLSRWREFQARWGADDRRLVVIIHPPAGGIDREVFAEIDAVAETLRRDPEVDATLTLGQLRPDRSQPPLTQMLAALPAEAAAAAMKTLLADARVVPLWISQDHRALVMLVDLATSTDDLPTTARTIERLRRRLNDLESSSALRFDLAGVPAVRGAFFRLTVLDQLRLVPLSILVVGIGLYVAFRSLVVLGIVAASVALPMLGLVGVMGWTGEPIGLLNQAYFTLLPVILVADTLHLLVAVRGKASRGLSWEMAIEAGTAKVGWACLLTSLTTAVGFASLASASMPILRNFGVYAALTVLAGYVTLVIVTPWLLAIGPPVTTPRAPGGGWTDRLGQLALRRPWSVLAVSSVLAIVAAGVAPRVVIDNRLSDLLLPDHPVSIATRTLDQHLGGGLALELELMGGPQTWPSDAGQRELAHWETWAQTQPEVRSVIAPRIDPQRLSADHVARISIRIEDAGARAFSDLEARVEAEIADRKAHGGPHGHVTGTPSLAYHGVNAISGDLGRSLIAALALVTLIIGILFRDAWWACMSLPPNVLPLLIGYALLVPLAIPLDPISGVILVVVLGLAVDDTIHLLAALRVSQREHRDFLSAARAALEESGHAVTITSVVLALGLAVNLASSFPPLRLLGGFGAALILLAWLGDVLLLPALMTVVYRRPSAGPSSRKGSESPAGSPH